MKTTTPLSIKRYPKSENRSLRAFSAADELILDYIANEEIDLKAPLLLNDRFGYLACVLDSFSPVSIVNYKSQEKALRKNMLTNKLTIVEQNIISPFDSVSYLAETVLLKVPKSLGLFQLQLAKIAPYLADNVTIVCGFMTRHFSKQMIEIASEYFDCIEQTKAKKKARLLILTNKKQTENTNLINEVSLNEETTFKQYLGVFSAKNIDFATQFFLENLKISKTENCVLDLASGNGVIAHAIRQQNPTAEIHLVDDSFLAVESSKINIIDNNTHHHFSDGLENFEPQFFDLVVSNPPYHFEHETNIEVALNLFKQVKKCLKPTGHFLLVSAVSLNFKTHLSTLFSTVNSIAENDKFVIYDCF